MSDDDVSCNLSQEVYVIICVGSEFTPLVAATLISEIRKLKEKTKRIVAATPCRSYPLIC